MDFYHERENLNKVCRNVIPSTLRVSQSSLLTIAILFINKRSAIYRRYKFSLFCLADADAEQGVLQWQPPVHPESHARHFRCLKASLNIINWFFSTNMRHHQHHYRSQITTTYLYWILRNVAHLLVGLRLACEWI